MNSSGLQPRFIKPFSKGQITLPKDYREYLGIDENSWLKIFIWDNQILLQPVEDSKRTRSIKPRVGREAYLKKLSKIKGGWFDKSESKKIRAEVEKRLLRNEKNFA